MHAFYKNIGKMKNKCFFAIVTAVVHMFGVNAGQANTHSDIADGASNSGGLTVSRQDDSAAALLVREASSLPAYAALVKRCRPIDPAYQLALSETGKQLFLHTQASSKTQQIFDLRTPVFDGGLQPLLIVEDTLDSTPKNYTLPMDSTIRQAVFFVGMDAKGRIDVIRPSGGKLAAADADSEVIELSCGRIFTINSPASGDWQLSIAEGRGRLHAFVMARSSVRFYKFEFLELKGRPGHEGLFPIMGEPLADVLYPIRSPVFGPVDTAAFELHALNGKLLRSVNSTKSADYSDGAVMPLSRAFRIYARGVTQTGENYLRVFSPIIQGRHLLIEMLNAPPFLLTGTTAVYTFKITRFGPEDIFTFSALDGQNFPASVSPSSVSLRSNATQVVKLSVTVPNETELEDTEANLTLFAEGTAGGHRFVTERSVKAGEDSDKDGVPDQVDRCHNTKQVKTVRVGECDSKIIERVLMTGCSISDEVKVCQKRSSSYWSFTDCVKSLIHRMRYLNNDSLLSGWEIQQIRHCIIVLK